MTIDRAALARRVPALEDDAQRRADRAVAELAAQREAQPQQPLLLLGQLIGPLLAGELQRQVYLVESSHGATLTCRALVERRGEKLAVGCERVRR